MDVRLYGRGVPRPLWWMPNVLPHHAAGLHQRLGWGILSGLGWGVTQTIIIYISVSALQAYVVLLADEPQGVALGYICQGLSGQ